MGLKSIKEFLEVIDDMYGVYLDGTRGFLRIKSAVEDAQSQYLKDYSGKITIDFLDECDFYHTNKPPITNDFEYLHTTSQGVVKNRNIQGGKNYSVLGNLCISMLFNYWEDWYRKAIAEEIGFTKKNDLKANSFGDLCKLRNSIVHHRGIAKPEVDDCTIFTWFKSGEEINCNEYQIQFIFNELKRDLTIIDDTNEQIMSLQDSISSFNETRTKKFPDKY